MTQTYGEPCPPPAHTIKVSPAIRRYPAQELLARYQGVSLDIRDDSGEHGQTSGRRRPYISILFDCCNVYARVYRRPDQPYYRGRCPKCLRPIQLRVGPDGTPARIFRAN